MAQTSTFSTLGFLRVAVAPKDYVKDYIVDIADVSQLPAEAMCWTDSKTFGKHESFTHQNM